MQEPEIVLSIGEAEEVITITTPRIGVRAYVGLAPNGAMYFGYAMPELAFDLTKPVLLERVRFLCMLSPNLRGWTDLAISGPDRQCRVSPSAAAGYFMLVSIVECQKKAAAAWEKEPWANVQVMQAPQFDMGRAMS